MDDNTQDNTEEKHFAILPIVGFRWDKGKFFRTGELILAWLFWAFVYCPKDGWRRG